MLFWKKHFSSFDIAKMSRTTIKGVADDGSKYNCIKYFIITLLFPIGDPVAIPATDPVEYYDCCVALGMYAFQFMGQCDGSGDTVRNGIISTPAFGTAQLRYYCDGDEATGTFVFAGGSGTGEIVIPNSDPHGWQADTVYSPSVATPTYTYSCYSRVDALCYPGAGSPISTCRTAGTPHSDCEAGSTCRDLIEGDFFDGYADCVPGVLL